MRQSLKRLCIQQRWMHGGPHLVGHTTFAEHRKGDSRSRTARLGASDPSIVAERRLDVQPNPLEHSQDPTKTFRRDAGCMQSGLKPQ